MASSSITLVPFSQTWILKKRVIDGDINTVDFPYEKAGIFGSISFCPKGYRNIRAPFQQKPSRRAWCISSCSAFHLFSEGMSPVIAVVQGIEGSMDGFYNMYTYNKRMDAIIRCTSDEGLSIILNFEDFPKNISSLMNTQQVSGFPTSKLGFNFSIFSDIDGLYSILNEAHQSFGAGSLLRHFWKWLLVLTSGEVDSLICDDALFDNVDVTTLQAMKKPIVMLPCQLYTLMWKDSSRQLQHVSRSPTEQILTRVFPNTKHGLNGRLLKAAVLQGKTCEKKIVNGTFTYTGFCDYIRSYISKSMNFR